MLVIITTALQYGLCVLLVKKIQLGLKGAAIATSIAFILNFLLAYLIQILHPLVKQTRVPFSYKQMPIKSFLTLGGYNLFMYTLRWWAF